MAETTEQLSSLVPYVLQFLQVERNVKFDIVMLLGDEGKSS